MKSYRSHAVGFSVCLLGHLFGPTAFGQTPPLAGQPAATATWESKPYQVKLQITTDNSAVWTTGRLRTFAEYIRASAKRTYGGAWQLEIVLPGKMDSTSTTRDEEPIKLSLASGQGSSLYLIAARGGTGSDGPVIEEKTPVLADVPSAAWSAVSAAFLPQAKVVGVQGDRVLLQARAAALVRDDKFAPLRPGAILRLANADAGALPLDATYLVVERVENALGVCRAVSRQGTARMVAGESLALQVPTGRLAPTTLSVFRQSDRLPLSGLRIISAPLSGEPQVLGETDAHGKLTLTALSHPLSTIAIYNGAELLERFPLVNGWPRELTVPVNVSPVQIGAQAVLAAQRDRISALALKREVALARAKSRSDAGKRDEAEALLKQLRDSLASEAKQIQTAIDEQKKAAGGSAALAAACDELTSALQTETKAPRIDQLASAIRPAPPPPVAPPMEELPKGWQRYKSTAGGFEVLFSGKPGEGKFDAMAGDTPVSLQYATAMGGENRPNLTVAWYDAAAAPMMEEVVGLFNMAYQAEPQEQQEISLATHKGLELRGSTQTGGSFVARIYTVGKRVYLAIVMMRGDASGSPDTKQFLDSFKLNAK